MQLKLTQLSEEAVKTGLRINRTKMENMRINNKQESLIHLWDENIKETDHSIYLESIVSKDGGSDQDIRGQLNKARHLLHTVTHLELHSLVVIRSGYSIPT